MTAASHCGPCVAGRYEGGFKLWEGGLDLAQFLALHSEALLVPASRCGSEPSSCGGAAPSGSSGGGGSSSGGSGSTGGRVRVLELGCGHGLPGLVALHGGAEVHFQVGGKEEGGRREGRRGAGMMQRRCQWEECCLLSTRLPAHARPHAHHSVHPHEQPSQ